MDKHHRSIDVLSHWYKAAEFQGAFFGCPSSLDFLEHMFKTPGCIVWSASVLLSDVVLDASNVDDLDFLLEEIATQSLLRGVLQTPLTPPSENSADLDEFMRGLLGPGFEEEAEQCAKIMQVQFALQPLLGKLQASVLGDEAPLVQDLVPMEFEVSHHAGRKAVITFLVLNHLRSEPKQIPPWLHQELVHITLEGLFEQLRLSALFFDDKVPLDLLPCESRFNVETLFARERRWRQMVDAGFKLLQASGLEVYPAND